MRIIVHNTLNDFVNESLILEKRSHADANVDLSFGEILEKIKQEDPTLENTFLSFRDSLHVTDINPNNTFNTPTGFYCYPLIKFKEAMECKDTFSFREYFPFQSNLRYFVFFKLDERKGVISKYTPEEKLDEYVYRIKEMFQENENVQHITEMFLNGNYEFLPEYYETNSKLQAFWNYIFEVVKFAYGFKKREDTVNKYKILCNKLGINGFIDYGDSYIHKNEPSQAVFFKVKTIGDVFVYDARRHDPSIKYDGNPNVKANKTATYLINNNIRVLPNNINVESIFDVENINKKNIITKSLNPILGNYYYNIYSSDRNCFIFNWDEGLNIEHILGTPFFTTEKGGVKNIHNINSIVNQHPIAKNFSKYYTLGNGKMIYVTSVYGDKSLYDDTNPEPIIDNITFNKDYMGFIVLSNDKEACVISNLNNFQLFGLDPITNPMGQRKILVVFKDGKWNIVKQDYDKDEVSLVMYNWMPNKILEFDEDSMIIRYADEYGLNGVSTVYL